MAHELVRQALASGRRAQALAAGAHVALRKSCTVGEPLVPRTASRDIETHPWGVAAAANNGVDMPRTADSGAVNSMDDGPMPTDARPTGS